MKGLLLKDFYTLFKQMKIMLLILVIFACMPGYSVASFAIFYAALLPVTALAYDERCKWNELAVMMPYSSRDIVLSKYVLGFIFVLAASAIAAAAQFITAALGSAAPDTGALLSLLLSACLSLILLDVNLPIMYRLGVEKGRIAFIILIFAGVMSAVSLGDRLIAVLAGFHSLALPTAGMLLFTVLFSAASAALSVNIYRHKTN